MKEKLKNKKVVYTIIGIISVLLVAIAVTYAYWLVTKTQTKENVISSGCLDISLSNEANDISLTNQFPMSDEDGKKLVPYEFTVTNNCNTSVDYQIALEAIGEESASISSDALKVALSLKNATNISGEILSSKAEVDPTIDGAYESRIIGFSRLASKGSEGASKKYNLRLWIDENASQDEMNKTFRSKITVTVGQGIQIPYEEGTLAYNVLSNNGGTGSVEELNAAKYIDNDFKNSPYSFQESWYPISPNTSYYWGTEYTFNDDIGKYKLSGDIVQATVEECRAGQRDDGTAVTCGEYTFQNSTDPEYEASGNLLKVISLTSEEMVDTEDSLYITALVKGTSYTALANGTTASDTGKIYKTQDDLGDSYYFRGNPTNNYVEFGTYAEDTSQIFKTMTGYDSSIGAIIYDEEKIEVKAGDPMYWRIVRINGDGTARLIYDGTELVANGKPHKESIGSTVYNTTKNVGYTYDDGNGNQVDSTIKGVVDAWYEANLKTNYGSYIADGIFCNDRSKVTTEWGERYRAFQNLLTMPVVPQLTCTNKSDRYTVEDTKNGNGLLSNPVGLLTADEGIFAGTTRTSGHNDQQCYLHATNNIYWTSTPGSDSEVWYVQRGFINFDTSKVDEGVDFEARPVINIKADIKFTGAGTLDNPYTLATN